MNKVSRIMMVSLIANMFLSIIKIMFGVVGYTKSLIADGIHSFSDLSTDIVGIIGSKLASSKEDLKHPYGHGKIEYVTSLIISISIIFLGYFIFKNALTSSNQIPNFYTSIVVIITIIIKFLVSRYLIKKGKMLNSNILISSGKESFTDVFTSVLVLIVIFLSSFYEKLSYLRYVDKIGSIIISVVVLVMGIRLLLENLSLLIDSVELDKEKILEVKKVIDARSFKFNLKKLELLKFGSYYKAVICIEVEGSVSVRSAHKLMDEIEFDLLNSNTSIKYVTIHIEPIEGSDKDARITRGRNSKRNVKKKSIKQKNKRC